MNKLPRVVMPLTDWVVVLWLGHCANSPGNRAYCYAELAVSSLPVIVTIASTHYADPQRDGQAE